MRKANDTQTWYVTFCFSLQALHHLSLQVLDRVEKLLGLGRAVETVDINDRYRVAHLIEPILNVWSFPLR